MFTAAQALLDLLDPAARQQIQFPFESPERFNWSYVPQARRGLPIHAMPTAQRHALHALLREALSSAGYLKATGIMQLETVLRALEHDNPQRDPEGYYLTIFGTPAYGTPWGWRIEGHHVSLNFTVGSDIGVSTTPAFLGANPAEVPAGPHTGWRVLGVEEDLARQLLTVLDKTQRAQAIIATTAPQDIIIGTDRIARLARFEGVPAADMSGVQRDVLLQLIREYMHNLTPALAQMQFDKIIRAGLDRLYFAWAGSLSPGQGHYYRIHGPATLIEYDNTQNAANHVHTVWRDLEHDWGGDALAQHYAESTHHRG
jgi:hypothetical protein